MQAGAFARKLLPRGLLFYLTSHDPVVAVCLSVCPFVTSWCSLKAEKYIITQTIVALTTLMNDASFRTTPMQRFSKQLMAGTYDHAQHVRSYLITSSINRRLRSVMYACGQPHVHHSLR